VSIQYVTAVNAIFQKNSALIM